MNKELYSFDIFDTLITRKTATPEGIFAIMQSVIQKSEEYNDLSEDFKENFYSNRINAALRRKHLISNSFNDQEATLDEIYEEIKANHGINSDVISKIKQLEIEIELSFISPIKTNISKIKELLSNNKRVILISDMYLPQNIIRQMLIKADNVFEDIPIYLSGDLRYTKSSSELFEYIKKIEKVEYKNWYHFGDNSHADYKVPKRLGINVKLFKNFKLEEFEKKVILNRSNDPLTQIMLGISKCLRLNFNNIKYSLGASIAAPIFYPYISWILNRSKEYSINDLYFIARDGYILKKITDVIIKIQNIDIKTHYLYGSRKAWRTPSLTLENQKLYQQYITSVIRMYKNLDYVLGIDKNKLIKILPYEFKNYSSIKYNKKTIKRLYDFLINNSEILNSILYNNTEKKNNVVNYLKKQIDLNKNCAFVDLDGSGLTQNCLAELINVYRPNTNIRTFYILSTDGIFDGVNVTRDYYSHIKGADFDFVHIIEQCAKAPQGQTIGYKDSEPIFEECNLDINKFWLGEDFLNGVLDFSCEISSIENKFEKFICFREQNLLENYMKYLKTDLPKKYANQLGRIVASAHGKAQKEFAPKLTIFNLFKYILFNKIGTDCLLISKKRSSFLVQVLIDVFLAIRSYMK